LNVSSPNAPLKLVRPGEAAQPLPAAGEPSPAVPPRDLGELFERYAPYVGTIALRLLGRPHEVDDLVQDVFLAAHRGLKRMDHDAEVRGWLARVTVRLARRRMHRLRIRGFLGTSDQPRFERLADRAASPEQQATIAAVYRVLDHQPANQRIAWVLRHVEGRALAEVADLCGCSLATAKRRIAATQAALEEVFGDT
jgi:RNA polymerase sigma-70 factor, ECF subfamily